MTAGDCPSCGSQATVVAGRCGWCQSTAPDRRIYSRGNATWMTAEDRRITRECSPQRDPPKGWTKVGGCENVWRSIHDKLTVIVTGRREGDGRRWMHVSVSHRDRLPTWPELKTVKDMLIGPDTVAIQVFPRAAEFVNVHPFCLHLWHCLDGDVIPDFRVDGQI